MTNRSLWFLSLRVLVYFSLASVLMGSCKPERMDDCFTTTGPSVEQQRIISPFHTIELYNNINLIIEPGNQADLRIKGGKNLLSSITTEVKDSILILRNLATCNWMRSYSREMTVYVTASALRAIFYDGYGDITMTKPIRLDSLNVNVWGGAGSLTLNVETEKLGLFLHYGTVDFNVKGKAVMTSIFANSYGPFYCNNLISNIVYIRNSGTNDCYVHARHILEAEISSVGNIYYTGDPYQIKSHITGSGKLIKKY
ncbi:MAG: DUF2807 domain-containing protein [Lentimicrobiaceae bacterium]|nr:DUF2807 domain-containing protein [Lentimicrobiaceae bacterium]